MIEQEHFSWKQKVYDKGDQVDYVYFVISGQFTVF